MKIISLIICLAAGIFSCTNYSAVIPLEPCDQCKLVRKAKLRAILHPLIYAKELISVADINQATQQEILRFSDELRTGYKFNACGCVEGKVYYQIYTATSKTYDLVAALTDDNSSFLVDDFFESEFSHP